MIRAARPELVERLRRKLRTLQHQFIFLGCYVGEEIVDRVNRSVVFMHLVMKVWCSRFSGIAHFGNYLSAFYLLASFYEYLAAVGIKGMIAKAMIDFHVVAISPLGKVNVDHHAIAGSINIGAYRSRKVDAFVMLHHFVKWIHPIAEK